MTTANLIPKHLAGRIALCVFFAAAAFFLWTENRAYVLGALPYALLLLCPLAHAFMHGRHRHRHHAAAEPGKAHDHIDA